MDINIIGDDLDYARRREASERAAAKYAPTLAARRVHQEMAQLYANKIQLMNGGSHEEHVA